MLTTILKVFGAGCLVKEILRDKKPASFPQFIEPNTAWLDYIISNDDLYSTTFSIAKCKCGACEIPQVYQFHSQNQPCPQCGTIPGMDEWLDSLDAEESNLEEVIVWRKFGHNWQSIILIPTNPEDLVRFGQIVNQAFSTNEYGGSEFPEDMVSTPTGGLRKLYIDWYRMLGYNLEHAELLVDSNERPDTYL